MTPSKLCIRLRHSALRALTRPVAFFLLLLGATTVSSMPSLAQDPNPSIESWSVSPTTIQLGEPVTVYMRVRNNGGSSPDGGMTFSFPDLDSSGDSSLVSVDSSPFSTVIRPAGFYPIYNSSNNPITASYLMVETAGNWSSGATHEFQIRVTPRSLGTFRVNFRSAMNNASGVYTNAPSSSSTNDQQQWPVNRETVSVQEPTGDLDFQVKNVGGSPQQGARCRLTEAPSWNFVSNDTSNSSGWCSWNNIPAGNYNVEVFNDGNTPYQEEEFWGDIQNFNVPAGVTTPKYFTRNAPWANDLKFFRGSCTGTEIYEGSVIPWGEYVCAKVYVRQNVGGTKDARARVALDRSRGDSWDYETADSTYVAVTTGDTIIERVFSSIQLAGTYSKILRVQWDNSGADLTTDTWDWSTTFTVDDRFPNPVTLSSPGNGSTGIGMTPTFSWSGGQDPDGNPVQFTLEISIPNSQAFDNDRHTVLPGNTFSFTVPSNQPLEPGSTYYWHVFSTDTSSNKQTFSDTWSFQTAPLNGAVNVNVRNWDGSIPNPLFLNPQDAMVQLFRQSPNPQTYQQEVLDANWSASYSQLWDGSYVSEAWHENPDFGLLEYWGLSSAVSVANNTQAINFNRKEPILWEWAFSYDAAGTQGIPPGANITEGTSVFAQVKVYNQSGATRSPCEVIVWAQNLSGGAGDSAGQVSGFSLPPMTNPDTQAVNVTVELTNLAAFGQGGMLLAPRLLVSGMPGAQNSITSLTDVWSFPVPPDPIFTVVPDNPPAPPTLQSPTNGSTGISRTPTLTWSGGADPDGDPVTFDVSVSYPDSVVWDNARTVTGIPGSTFSYTIPGGEPLDWGAEYRWRVESRSNNNLSPSETWSFEVERLQGGVVIDVRDWDGQIPGPHLAAQDAKVRLYRTAPDLPGFR